LKIKAKNLHKKDGYHHDSRPNKPRKSKKKRKRNQSRGRFGTSNILNDSAEIAKEHKDGCAFLL